MNQLHFELGWMRRLAPYGVAIASTGFALRLSLWFAPLLEGTIGSFFYIAIIVSTWYGGIRPGIVAIVLSFLAINYFFTPPIHQFSIASSGDIARLGIFLLVALVINLLNSDLRRSKHRVEQLNRQLLQESSDRLKMALTAAQMGMWDWDRVTGEIVWSPEHEQLFGLAPGTFDGRYETFDACLHPDDRAGLMQILQTALQNHTIYQYEYRVIWADGSIHWVEGRGQAFCDEAGQPIRMSGTVMNIDDRKQAEAELRRLNTTLEQRVAERTTDLSVANDRLQKELFQRERIERALRASEVRFRSAFEYAAIGMALVKPDGHWLRVNRALCDIVGYSDQELLATDFQTITHPDDLTTDLSYVHQLLNDEIQTYQMEKRYIHKHGQIVWVLLSVSLVRDEQNQPLYFISQIQDISDRKHIEAALQESELKFHAMFDQSRLFIGLLRPDGVVFEVNLRPHELTTMMGEVFVGRRFWELAIWGTEQQTQMQDVFDRALAGEVVQIERVIHALDGSVVKLPDGSWVTHDIRVKAVKNAADQVMFLTVEGWDITALKQAEAELREADRRWRSLFDNVQLVVIELDIQGNVQYANPCFLHLTGYKLEDVLGRNWFDRFLSLGQRQPVETCFREVLEHHGGAANMWVTSGRGNALHCPYSFHVHYQNPILTQAGEERMIAWNNTVLRDTSGQPIGTISIGEDITERYQLEQMKVEFVSVVSHELRTPLTSMQAALSLLVEKIIDPTSEEGEAIIQIASDGVDRLVRLVNDILDLERLESGKIRLEKRRCNPTDLMAIAVDQMQEMAKQGGIMLDVTSAQREMNAALRIEGMNSRRGERPFAPTEGTRVGNSSLHDATSEMNADPDRILQVLTNLLSNAIKFAPSGSVVWLSVEPEIVPDSSAQTYLRFMVKDAGRGIPAEKLESIFERFQQVDASDSRQKGGTGLGLAICRSIVEQHGGRIWAESCLGQGSTFYFRIPVLDKTSDDTETSFDH